MIKLDTFEACILTEGVAREGTCIALLLRSPVVVQLCTRVEVSTKLALRKRNHRGRACHFSVNFVLSNNAELFSMFAFPTYLNFSV